MPYSHHLFILHFPVEQSFWKVRQNGSYGNYGGSIGNDSSNVIIIIN
jgi:hypothetical protein